MLAQRAVLCAQGGMLRVDTSRWHQTPDDLRRLALESAHPRTRERFLALYEVTEGSSALNWAARTDRRHSTILEWIHTYNERGPEALIYQRTGGWPPFFLRCPIPSRR